MRPAAVPGPALEQCFIHEVIERRAPQKRRLVLLPRLIAGEGGTRFRGGLNALRVVGIRRIDVPNLIVVPERMQEMDDLSHIRSISCSRATDDLFVGCEFERRKDAVLSACLDEQEPWSGERKVVG